MGGLIPAIDFGPSGRYSPPGTGCAPRNARRSAGRSVLRRAPPPRTARPPVMNRAESFESEALPHLDAVYRFALRLTGSAADAEDLTQETFLRAFRAWDRFTPGTRAKSWLFTICRNTFLRQRKRESHHREILERHTPAPTGSAVVDTSAVPFLGDPVLDPEGDFFRSFLDRTVLDAIDSLPAEFREVVTLADLEGLAYAEIAEVLELPVGTVKSRLFRGRRLLQERLRDYAADQGIIPAPAP